MGKYGSMCSCGGGISEELCSKTCSIWGRGGFPKALTKKKIVHMKGTCENDTKTEI